MELKQRMRALWGNSNQAERMLWQVLHNPQHYNNLHDKQAADNKNIVNNGPFVNHLAGCRFARHVNIGEHYVDFMSHQLQVVITISIDNNSPFGLGINPNNTNSYVYERTTILQHQGYLVVRVLQQDIINNFKAVLDNLNILLCQRKLQLLRNQEELTWI